MVKSFKNLLLQNWKSYDPVYINDDRGLNVTYFTARSNSVTNNKKSLDKAFLEEKVKTVDIHTGL